MSAITGMAPMKYDEVPVEQIDRYLADDGWVMQQKVNGFRCMAVIDAVAGVRFLTHGGRPLVSMRRQVAGITAQLRRAQWRGVWVLDGELMDDGTWWLFDVPMVSTSGIHPGRTLFRTRLAALDLLPGLAGWRADSLIRVVPTAEGTKAKRALWKRVQADGLEGVCVKRLDGIYLPPSRSSQRSTDVLKVKITKTVDAFITAVTSEPNSVTLGMYDNDGKIVEVGRATNRRRMFSAGQVVEVRILDVGSGGRLYQPCVLHARTDKTAAECRTTQLDALVVNRAVLAS